MQSTSIGDMMPKGAKVRSMRRLRMNRTARNSVELAFAEKPLRQLCESEEAARRILGEQVATKLRRRLADLRAAATIKDLVVGRPREIEGTSGSAMAIDLHRRSRMVFDANHNSIPTLKSGRVDWSRVTRIKILRIDRYDT